MAKTVVKRIDRVLMNLPKASRPHGCVKLKGIGAYRLRVGDYRIIYDIDDTNRQIKILAIGHRREVYR